MSDEPATPDQVAALYLRDRDVPCPDCGYNRRDSTACQCPECGHALTLGPTMPDHIFCRVPTLAVLAWSVLGCACFSALYFGSGLSQYYNFSINPFNSLLEFAVTIYFLASLATVVLSAAQLWRWRAQRHSPQRSTRLLIIATLLFHISWALFLILGWLETT